MSLFDTSLQRILAMTFISRNRLDVPQGAVAKQNTVRHINFYFLNS